MADLEGIVLHKVLNDSEKALEHWAKLKPGFFSSDYQKIFVTVFNFYDTKGSLPSFNDLEVSIRNQESLNRVVALKHLEVPEDIDLALAIEALIDTYTQDEALKELDTFVDNITFLATDEIKEGLAQIVLRIEDKTQSTDEVYNANEMVLFDEEELLSRVMLGLNNSFDAHTGGAAMPELIMIGGYRGSGKSVVCSNLAVNQYNANNVSVYFTIEMPANQVLRRNMAIMSGVNASRIKKHKCTDIEYMEIAKKRAGMFLESDDMLKDYLDGKYQTYTDFDTDLMKHKPHRPNPMIILKNRNLTLTEIDIHLSRLKERHGEKLKVCVIDYINQLAVQDMYDWKVQINLSKQLKNLAEKHEVVMVTPYQIDKTGEARFSKGILDAADIAMTLEKGQDFIKMKTSKIRDDADIEFASEMDWDCLKIFPTEKIFTDDSDEEADEKTGNLVY